MVWFFQSSSQSARPTYPDPRRRGVDGSRSRDASTSENGSSDMARGWSRAEDARPRPSAPQPSGSPRLHVSEENAECAVCFDPLCAAPAAVFVRQSRSSRRRRRTCSHFFHLTCAKDVAEHHRSCPVCRAPFQGVLPVPNPRDDPDAWFAAVDADGDGKLSPSEVVEVLRAQLPCDWRAIERQIVDDGAFRRWDPDGDGFIERWEMVRPGGLLDFVRRNFPRDASPRPPPPSLAAAPDRWFRHWDEDGDGTLDKDEVTRALVKTFQLRDDLRQVREIRGVVDAVWSLFDADGDGRVDRNEFLARDGLAETIVASVGTR
jgi:hypothetical protein